MLDIKKLIQVSKSYGFPLTISDSFKHNTKISLEISLPDSDNGKTSKTKKQITQSLPHYDSTSQDEECDLDRDNVRNETKLCPDFSCYLYFLFAPTLVYRDIYPRYF